MCVARVYICKRTYIYIYTYVHTCCFDMYAFPHVSTLVAETSAGNICGRTSSTLARRWCVCGLGIDFELAGLQVLCPGTRFNQQSSDNFETLGDFAICSRRSVCSLCELYARSCTLHTRVTPGGYAVLPIAQLFSNLSVTSFSFFQ